MQKRKWPTFVHPESGKRFRVEDQKELENLIRECNAAWVHPIGDLGTSVRFHDMLPDVEYGAVTALVRLLLHILLHMKQICLVFVSFLLSNCILKLSVRCKG